MDEGQDVAAGVVGTYQVGVDIKPGTYVSCAPDSCTCYWVRLSGSNGFDDILANNNRHRCRNGC